MTEEMVAHVAELNKKLIVTKNLMQLESRASIPENYLNSIKQLVIIDNKAREDFYKLIRALGTKYNKLYKDELKRI